MSIGSLTDAPNTPHRELINHWEGMVEMTHAQRQAIREELARWTAEAVKDPTTARRQLIEGGFYTEKGKLTPEYGGKSAKKV